MRWDYPIKTTGNSLVMIQILNPRPTEAAGGTQTGSDHLSMQYPTLKRITFPDVTRSRNAAGTISAPDWRGHVKFAAYDYMSVSSLKSFDLKRRELSREKLRKKW